MESDRVDEISLSADEGAGFCLDMLGQLSVPDEEARACADSLVDASLRGVDSHGVTMVAIYAERIRSGQIRPGRKWIVRREGPGSALCDGQHGVGPHHASAAVDLAVAKARKHGLGGVSLFDGNYVGALAFYVVRVAEAGMLGLCTANSTPRVAPFGGREGLHGTNPIAYAAPRSDGQPLLFDAATGHAAARIGQALDEGKSIPEGTALDQEGEPTTDAAAALEGTLLPVGGVIGYGMGLLADLLSGGLAGGPCGADVPPVSETSLPYGCGFFVLAIDPERFGGVDIFRERTDFLSDSARNISPARGFKEVRVPGDGAARKRVERLCGGIPIRRNRWQATLERLAGCGLDVAAWEGK